MRTVKIADKEVEIYDAINELPIVRFHKYNKYLLVDVGVGADLSNIDNHIERAMRFLKENQNDALKELEALRQCIYLIQQEISPKYYAFACLVKSINGVPKDDLSDEGIKKTIAEISEATKQETDFIMESVKKKIDAELSDYFPAMFDDVSVKEFYDQQKNLLINKLEEIITGKDRKKEIDELTNLLITYIKPQIFWGKESAEINYEKQFENMCLMLSQKLNVQAKNMTVLEYYNAFIYLKDQNKKETITRKK